MLQLESFLPYTGITVKDIPAEGKTTPRVSAPKAGMSKAISPLRALMTGKTVKGFEPLCSLLEDDEITDIMINRHDRVFIERDGRMERADLGLESTQQVMELSKALLDICNLHGQNNKHMIDVTMPDGSRMNVMLPPVAVDCPSISIRTFARTPLTLSTMVEQGSLEWNAAMFLKYASQERVNFLVSGGSSTGKTTVLGAMCSNIASQERIVAIEDTPEIPFTHSNVVRLTTHDLDVTGHHRIDMRSLVRSALRMRPDRIILGEVRGPEAFDLLQTMNTGHDGSCGTVHANTPREVVSRLENMISIAYHNLSPVIIRKQITASIDLIIHTGRDENNMRRIQKITEILNMEGETPVMQDLFTYHPATGQGDGRTRRSGHYEWANIIPRSPKLQRAAKAAGLTKV